MKQNKIFGENLFLKKVFPEVFVSDSFFDISVLRQTVRLGFCVNHFRNFVLFGVDQCIHCGADSDISLPVAIERFIERIPFADFIWPFCF